jgi:hypothetical protein
MSESTELTERKVDHEVADQITVDKGGITFQNAGEIMQYAKMMAASDSAVPVHLRGKPGACLGIIDDSIRFGLNPYALARKSYFVNDQLAYEAQVFAAIVNARAPIKARPEIRFDGEGANRRCTVTATFHRGNAVREYVSPRIGDIQPKHSPLWKSDPDQQLSYYSLRAFARRWCPEVILGVHDADELREAAMADVTPLPPMPTRLDDFARPPEARLSAEPQGAPYSGTGEESAADTAPTVDAAPEPPLPEQTPTERDWYREGAEAGLAGKPRKVPAEIRGTGEGLNWQDGYDTAKGE